MQKIIISVILIFSLSFCKQKDEPEPEAEPAFELNIRQASIKLDESYIGVIENCNFILANITTARGNVAEAQFRIEFVLTKSGLINKVSFFDYSNNNKKFATTDFQPAHTFSITNLVTSPTAISFDFSGELYEVGSLSNNTLTLSGKVNYKKYQSIA